MYVVLLFQPHLKSEIRACGLSVNQMRVNVVFVTIASVGSRDSFVRIIIGSVDF